MSNVKLTAVFEEAPEGGYVAWVEELPGAHTQGETLDEARRNLTEVIQLLFEVNRDMAEQEIKGARVIREPIEATFV